MTLADQDARTRIETSLDETLFVEAGAGTGKTHQLVERIVNLIADGGVPASAIAAITFTEKAAAELYDRVLEALDTERARSDDPARQRLFAEAAAQLDRAAIETLHAFAGRILRMHPIEAGLPPAIRMLDDSEASLRFNERWNDGLDAILEDPELADSLLFAFDAGVTLDSLKAVAQALHANWDRALRPEAELSASPVDAESFLGRLRSVIGERHRCLSEEDKLYLRLNEYEAYLQRLIAVRDRPGRFLKLLAEKRAPAFKVTRVGNNKHWPDGELPQIRERILSLIEMRDELRTQLLQSGCAPVVNAIRQFVLNDAEQRRRDGVLEFQDLLVRASALLESNDAVAAALRERFQRLLIDEFQDNDPLQTGIIDAITQGEAGRAFYVGDPKQSIYRFRRADIKQFNRVKDEQQAGLTRLTQNFRSAPGVTTFVNQVFSKLMGGVQVDPASDGSAAQLVDIDGQAEWDQLHPYRTPYDDSTPVVTVLDEVFDKSVSAAQVRRIEADALARMITDAVASRWQVYDRSEDCWRDARFADIAVLARSRSGFQQLLTELETQQIPYRLESRSLIYDSEQVRQLLSLLQSIDDPTDQIALLAALRSPAFACADDDLYHWKRAGGLWDYRQSAPAGLRPDDPVAEAMSWLRDAAAGRWQLTVSALVGQVIRERRLMELAATARQPREHWARYRFLHDQARAFSDRGGATLTEFLAWARHQAEMDTRVDESVVPEADHDAVRIMTIHAAKGLEFPIVVSCGLNVNRPDRPPTLLWQPHGRPEVKLGGGLETAGFAELWERDKLLQLQELVRLQYVATTRARDHLVVSLYRKSTGPASKRKNDAQRVAEALGEHHPGAPYRLLSHDDTPLASPLAEEQNAPDAAPQPLDRDRWLAQREQAVRRWATSPRASATGVAALADSGREAPAPRLNLEPGDDLPPWRRGRAGTAIGRATHGVLQVIDLERADPVALVNAARAQAAAESLSGAAAAEVERLALRATRSATVREAVAADRYWRELYAAVEIDGVLLEGFVDLLYETDAGELVVVDYKTDALSPGEAVDEAVQRYRLQAAAYALMLEASLDRPVARCLLLFLHADEAREVSDLPEAISEVRAALARSAQPTAPAS